MCTRRAHARITTSLLGLCVIFVCHGQRCGVYETREDVLKYLQMKTCRGDLQGGGENFERLFHPENPISCLLLKDRLQDNDDFQSVPCACPAGFTDPTFTTDEERAKGIGTVNRQQLIDLYCTTSCSEQYAKIIHTERAGMYCLCLNHAGCSFRERVIRSPTDASDLVLAVLPDNLQLDSKSVSCMQTCLHPHNATASDVLTCEQYDKVTPCNAPDTRDDCPEREFWDSMAGLCRPCSVCPVGHGVDIACTSLSDTTCRRCHPNEYVDELSSRCMQCDYDQTYDPSKRRCVFLQRAIVPQSNDCKNGTIYVEHLPVTDKCRACANNEIADPETNTCRKCKPHEYKKQVYDTKCSECPLSHIRRHSDGPCEECQEGRERLHGQTKCTPCQPGFIRSSGLSVCHQCLPGFQHDTQRRHCVPCTESEHCPTKCKPGYFLTAGQCMPCFEQKRCPRGMIWACHQCVPQKQPHDTHPCVESFRRAMPTGTWHAMQTLKNHYKMLVNETGSCPKDTAKPFRDTTAFVYLKNIVLDDRHECFVCCDPTHTFSQNTATGRWECS